MVASCGHFLLEEYMSRRFEDELFEVVNDFIRKSAVTGELELRSDDGSSRVTWIGNKNQKDVAVTINIEPLEKKNEREISRNNYQAYRGRW